MLNKNIGDLLNLYYFKSSFDTCFILQTSQTLIKKLKASSNTASSPCILIYLLP